MKTLRASAVAKLVIGLLVIALLTGCAYFGVIGVAFTVLPADQWAGAVLNMAMGNHTQQVMEYYELHKEYETVKEKDVPQWAKENLARYEALFDPESTNFRFVVMDENGEKLFGNYDEEAYLARSYDWEQRFVGTELDRQRLEAFENGVPYDYETDTYLSERGDSRFAVQGYHDLPKTYVYYDENGYLYDKDEQAVARVENYTAFFGDLNGPSRVNGSNIMVDGKLYYPVDPDVGYPFNFAYFDDYGNFYDGDFNVVAFNGEEESQWILYATPTPAPMPTAQVDTETSDASKPDVKPEIVALPVEFTQQDYEALYDKCYEEYTIRGYIPEELTVQDSYHDLYRMVLQYDAMKDEYVSNAVGLGICGLVLLLVLLVLAGKRNEEGLYEEVGLGRLPWDVWCALIGCLAIGVGCVVALAVGMVVEALRYGMGQVSMDTQMFSLLIYGCILAAAVCVAWLTGTLHSLAARLKVKGWWRNCLCWKVFLWCWNLCVKCIKWCWKLWLLLWGGCKSGVRSVPMIWKAAVVLGIICVGEIITCAMIPDAFAVVGMLLAVLKFIICMIICLVLKRLQQGARTIADGDLNHRIDTTNLRGDFKEHADCLNRIGDGLSHSVDAQLRSERMKTELITNVSHDLKTPLTSIVNYVDLLKKEELTGNAAEYVEVLDRQAARLKKLTEDLVEASKASSGALNVTVERVSLTELLEQAQAEYAMRLGEIGLQSIVRQPEGEVMVWADGRYVWRILDNLLSNVCKYAMPNTRVYLELRTEGDRGVLSVKNMSRESLNISAEELMERFVRGDSSRNTEGSGLGLSIAQSLAKLMGGEVCITIDGDLFKADVILPMAK